MISIAAALPGADDTIVAVATPPGRGALAVVRMSGPRALEIAGVVVQPWPLEPGRARWCSAIDAGGDVVDRPVVTIHARPRSYTGEDVVELCTHGGLVAPARVVAALVAAGARPAHPGEFTRRAVLNGKLDLAQAEAIGDLIDARSGAMQRAAMAQLDGGLSRRVAALRDAVLEVEALIAYDIDFPEEDDGPVARTRVAAALSRAADQVAALLATAPMGDLVRAGAVTVIAGAPNVGKSSLFNALVGRARALVSDIPGTTRDAIDALIEPPGARFPLRLVDTAGLREGADTVERLGIEVSEQALADAHIVLACGDTLAGVADAVRRTREHTTAPVVGVWTKRDAGPSGQIELGETPEVASLPPTMGVVAVSAHSGAGLQELLDHVVCRVEAQSGGGPPTPDTPIVTRSRHRAALSRAADELADFGTAWAGASLPAIVAAVHLRAAAAALEEIIGAVGVDDVLARVFADFCVGK
jgi:tRNA modification GTPase